MLPCFFNSAETGSETCQQNVSWQLLSSAKIHIWDLFRHSTPQFDLFTNCWEFWKTCVNDTLLALLGDRKTMQSFFTQWQTLWSCSQNKVLVTVDAGLIEWVCVWFPIRVKNFVQGQSLRTQPRFSTIKGRFLAAARARHRSRETRTQPPLPLVILAAINQTKTTIASVRNNNTDCSITTRAASAVPYNVGYKEHAT